MKICCFFFRAAWFEEKKRLEAKITELEEDVEEAQVNYETANEKARRATSQVWVNVVT